MRISSRNVLSDVGVSGSLVVFVFWLGDVSVCLMLFTQDTDAKCRLSDDNLVKVMSQSSQRWMGMGFFRKPRCAVLHKEIMNNFYTYDFIIAKNALLLEDR